MKDINPMGRHQQRSGIFLAVLAWLVAMTAMAAGEKTPGLIPVEDFARSPDLSGAKLSPDGKFMGYLFTHEGRKEVCFLDFATGKAQYFNPGRSVVGTNLQMDDFIWVSNDRVVVKTTAWEGQFVAGLAAVTRNATGWLGLTGAPRWDSLHNSSGVLQAYEVIYASGTDPTNVLLLEQTAGHGEKLLYPDVIKMDTTTGRYQRVLSNPGHVIQWLTDWAGEVRFGLEWDGRNSRLTYRETPAAPWQLLPDLGNAYEEFSFVGMDQAGQIIHVSKVSPKGRWALVPLDLQQKQLGDAMFAHDEFDIVPPNYQPSYAGVPLAAAVYSAKSRNLLGIRYVTDGPAQYWFDPVLANLQRTVDALHPDLTNLIVSLDQSETRLLVLSYSDRDPGFYSLIDLVGKKVNLLGRRMPWIKPDQLATMYPIKCKARDGLSLSGYLTLPVARNKKNLPLVMLVHGGPWVRDVWGFDPVVQFLANRGYAVLQINYRGSTGYGMEFAAKGRKQVGGAIQDDITDAVRWAVQAGFADARRIAIMGASYGGYSTLFALAKTPELYRCGIDIAGVTDWPDLLEQHNKDGEFKIAYAYWEDRVGSLENQEVRQRLTEVSPVHFAEKIKVPLLIIHGKDDPVVPVAQSKRLITLLKQQGHAPETLFLSDLGHAMPHDKQGVVFLRKLETFLAAHMAP